MPYLFRLWLQAVEEAYSLKKSEVLSMQKPPDFQEKPMYYMLQEPVQWLGN
jgi:hypothetical protein